jgi:putative glycosyltransferase
MKLSIVSTLYRSEPFVREFIRRSIEAASAITDRYEIVLVNDCSPDHALRNALQVQADHKQVRIVDLAQNVGHHRALMAGLCFARGERVLLIDSDLEEDPAWLSIFWTKMDSEKVDVVFGVQNRRKGNFLERWSGSAFYALVNMLTRTKIQTNSVTARLMTARYVAALTSFREREFAIGDLWVNAGFEQVPVFVDKLSRDGTSYTIFRRIRNAVQIITSTSTVPLWIIFVLGLGISLFAALYITYLLCRVYFVGIAAEGWASLIVSVWLLGGLMLMSVGTIGIYLARVFHETKRRPYIVVRDVHDPGGHVWPTYPIEAAGLAPPQVARPAGE